MRIIEEPIAVLRDSGEAGLILLMGGYRITLTVDEARSLIRTLHVVVAEVSGEPGEVEPQPADRATIVAKVTEQLISWAEIAEAAQRR